MTQWDEHYEQYLRQQQAHAVRARLQRIQQSENERIRLLAAAYEEYLTRNHPDRTHDRVAVDSLLISMNIPWRRNDG